MLGPAKVGVIVAQAILHKEDPNVIVDGVLGPVTVQAFEDAAEAVKAHVNESLAQATAFSSFDALRTAVGPKDAGHGLSFGQLDQAVNAAFAATAGQSHVLNHQDVIDFIGIEDASRDPTAGSNTPYKGLMQMSRNAWTSARQMDPGLPEYDAGWHDPVLNIRAGIAYADFNAKLLRSHGYSGPFTVAVMYAAHNQGVGGFLAMLRNGVRATVDAVGRYLVSIGQRTTTGAPGQSPHAIRTLALSLAQARHSDFASMAS